MGPRETERGNALDAVDIALSYSVIQARARATRRTHARCSDRKTNTLRGDHSSLRKMEIPNEVTQVTHIHLLLFIALDHRVGLSFIRSALFIQMIERAFAFNFVG